MPSPTPAPPRCACWRVSWGCWRPCGRCWSSSATGPAREPSRRRSRWPPAAPSPWLRGCTWSPSGPCGRSSTPSQPLCRALPASPTSSVPAWWQAAPWQKLSPRRLRPAAAHAAQTTPRWRREWHCPSPPSRSWCSLWSCSASGGRARMPAPPAGREGEEEAAKGAQPCCRPGTMPRPRPCSFVTRSTSSLRQRKGPRAAFCQCNPPSAWTRARRQRAASWRTSRRWHARCPGCCSPCWPRCSD
mmetsp:Transcript_24696/g.68736  ORF Transcript_24696/g.68736 Transcript_24696/m.68736 type:complete len:244 (+) Transcript_24696:5675-6406(+)